MPDMTGRTLGKYRLIERLGRGGMAEVYRAFQPSLERDVAIKVMHGYLAEDEEFIGRFKREAKAVAALRHPHIVQVYDFDVEDDMYYMVMEYIDGETLKDRLKRLNAEGRQMSLEEVARIFRALCDALDYAHEQGRIHRDIKPANVMFDGDRLILTDFGLATIVGGTRYTLDGSVIGTPAYMSPEQAQGKAGDVCSDVYALGIILYEVVTGQIPYDADTPLAIIMKHVNEPLPLPSRLRVKVPEAVERVILKALAKSPDDRYQSAGALADALEVAVESVEQSAEVVTPPPAPPVEVTAPVVETPPPVAVPSAEMIPPSEEALLVGTAPVSEVAPPTDVIVPPELARPARKRIPWIPIGAAVLVVAVLAIVGVFVLPELVGGKATPTAGRTELTPKPPPPDQPPPPDPEARAHFDAGARALESWDLEKAIEELTKAIEIEPEFAEAYHLRGVAHRENDQPAEAESDLSRAISLLPALAPAYFDRAVLYLDYLDQVDKALDDLKMAIELRPEFVDAYIFRAQIFLWYIGDYGLAMADLDRAIEVAPDHAEAWCMRGDIHLSLDEYDRAMNDLIHSLGLYPEDSYCQSLLGFVHFLLEQYDQAVVRYNQAIRLEPGDLDLYYQRAFAYLGTGDIGAALEDWEKVLRVEPDHAGAHYGRGRALAMAGRYEEAIEEFSKTMEYDYSQYDWPYFQEASPYIDRALAYYELGDIEAALADLAAVIDEDPYWYLPYYHRGIIFKEIGDVEAAAADFRTLWETAPDEHWRTIAEQELDELGE